MTPVVAGRDTQAVVEIIHEATSAPHAEPVASA
jgi:hypothetical protein